MAYIMIPKYFARDIAVSGGNASQFFPKEVVTSFGCAALKSSFIQILFCVLWRRKAGPFVMIRKRKDIISAWIFVFVASAVTWTGASPQAAADSLFRPIDASYKLTFDDEFNGNSVDTTKWTVGWFANKSGVDKPVNANELDAYDTRQVSVSGGMLDLQAVAAPLTIQGRLYPYRSGLVNTIGKFSQAFGYFESRICLAGSGGVIANWPAWWLVGADSPNDGELDIMEGLSGQAAYHFHSPSGGPGASVVGNYLGCHVFAALWEPGIVNYFYDGVSVGQITIGITSLPQSMILVLAIGGYGGPVEVPSDMKVDYVRAWSNNPSAQAVQPQPGYDGPAAAANQPAAVAAPKLVASSFATNLLENPSFGNGSAGWTPIGQAEVVATATQSNQMAAMLSGQAGFQQNVKLKAHTSYVLSGDVKSLNGTCAAIGVKNFGRKQVANCSSSLTWSVIQFPFTTGADAEKATIFVWENSGSSMIDNLALIQR